MQNQLSITGWEVEDQEGARAEARRQLHLV